MAGGHLGSQQYGIPVGLFMAKRGNPFRRLDEIDPGVIEGRHREDGRVLLSLDILIRRVGLHVEVDVAVLDRVTPFVPFGHRQRQRRIQDRRQRIDEGDRREDAGEQVRRHIRPRAHQQAPGAAAQRNQIPRSGDTSFNEMFCGTDEVGEGVLLLQQLAAFVPHPPHFAAAADVGHREHHPAIQQGKPGDGETGIFAGLVGAVAVQHCGSGEFNATAIHHRQRYAGAVVGDGPVPPFHIVLTPIVPEYRLLPQQNSLPGRQVDVVDTHRGQEGGGTHPQARAVPVRVATQAAGHQFRVEGDLLGRSVAVAVDRPELQFGQGVPPVVHHQVIGEGVDILQSYVIALGDQGALRGGVVGGRLYQDEIRCAVVVQDQETIVAADDGVFDAVLDTLAAR